MTTGILNENMSADAEGGDPKYDYDHEPRRIRKGGTVSRWLLRQLGVKSAREQRLDEESNE